MKKVIVAGHICLDITPQIYQNLIEKCLQPGKLLEVGMAEIHSGGAVANTGLAMKKFGIDVKLIGKIGSDEFGEILSKQIKSYNTEQSLVIDLTTPTSYSIVISPPTGDRIFLHNPGANHRFKSDDIKETDLIDVSLFHFGYPTLMKSMYEKEGKELIDLFSKVKAKGIMTSLDLAAIDEESDVAKMDWKKILEKTMPHVDIFAPSAEEICYILDKEKYNQWQTKANGEDITDIINIEEDIKPLGVQLVDMGAKIVLIKCGKKGLFYQLADNHSLKTLPIDIIKNIKMFAGQNGFEPSFVASRVLSATGAGDTTIAAFLSSLLQGYTFDKCLQYATATGALNVTEYDALTGLRDFNTIDNMINDGWQKNL